MTKQELIDAFNALNIEDMEQVTELHELAGHFVNLEYTLSNGTKVKLLDDEKTYLGNQLNKRNSERCFGLVTDGKMLLVCEYGDEGRDAEIVVCKRL